MVYIQSSSLHDLVFEYVCQNNETDLAKYVKQYCLETVFLNLDILSFVFSYTTNILSLQVGKETVDPRDDPLNYHFEDPSDDPRNYPEFQSKKVN